MLNSSRNIKHRGAWAAATATATAILAAGLVVTAGSSASLGPRASESTATTASSTQFENYAAKLAPPNFTAPTKKYKLVLLTASTVLPQQKSIEVGVQAAAKKYGMSLTVYDAGGFQNIETQVSQFNTALTLHPNAIMILPASPVAFNAEIAKARAEGIKVLPILIPPPTAKFDFALADNLPADAGTALAALAARLHGRGNLYSLNGAAGSTVTQLFAQGLKAALPKYPGMHVIFTKNLPGFDVGQAESAVQDALVSEPNVSGIITNDVILGVGASNALIARGKGKIPIAGIGPDNLLTIDALKAGHISVAAGPPFYQTGYATAQWAAYLLEGHRAPVNVETISPLVLTKANIGAAISSGELFQDLAPSTVGCGPGQPKSC